MAYCPECGAALDDGARFCATCGHEVPKLATTPSAAPGAVPAGSQAGATAKAVSEMIMHDVPAPTGAGESVISTWTGSSGSDTSAHAVAAAQQVTSAAGDARREAQAHQPSANGPSVHFASSEGGAATAAKKKSKLPLVVGGVAAVAVIAVLALYIVPLFIPHPHDPHEDMVLTSGTAQTSSSASSASNEAASAGAESASASASSSAAVASNEVSPASSAAASSASSSSTTVSTSYSTYEKPKLSDFDWLDGEAVKGNVPADAQRIVDLDALTGSWKGYIFGSDSEWLANPLVDVGQVGATMAIDWYYVRFGGSGDGQEDATPTSTFEGMFDGGMLDVTGSGRVTIAAFWEKNGHQYATGSFMWPSGETCTIALVRP